MRLHTASEIISFAKKLESESANFYKDLSQRHAKDEDLFLSLYEDDNDEEETSKERAILKQILALLLERKRILRRLKGQKTENLVFIHVRSKQEFVVGMADFAIPDIAKIQDQLKAIVI